ncbi:GyrI-like domain-containing protein [Microbulbifer sp. JSM ZJ756]|uniref:GyrI-like domain-containing protein n=1 Tax=Microbulbifer sp. JSM ZJ756 TaxID=3376191 RepID=UPI0037AD6F74
MNTRNRIEKLRAYIDANLDGDLGLVQLSRVAHLSRYHLHRCFSASQGITLARYISRLRLRRAAWQLAYRPALPVTDIALAAGYGSTEAFSRAFQRLSGSGPTKFRTQPDWAWLEGQDQQTTSREVPIVNNINQSPTVELVQFAQVLVARLDHVGPPQLLGDTIRKFIAWRRLHGLSPAKSRTFNLVFDDPSATPAAEYRFSLCAETRGPVDGDDTAIYADMIPGGRCARVRHCGPDSGLEGVVRALYSDWLPGSGEELRDFPLFFERVSFFPDVPEAEMVTDIYLPLA